MTELERQQLSGRLFALEVLVCRLLTQELTRIPEKLEMLEQIEADIERESARLSPVAIAEAKETLVRMRKSSLPRSVYLSKSDDRS